VRGRPGPYQYYWVCTHCRRLTPIANRHFVDRFFAPDPCPRCGASRHEHTARLQRWVSTEVWWRPRTWGTGYWEVLEDDLWCGF